MNTFKQSAIEILKKAGTPLHYTEITRLALESSILETEGATPEATMNARIVGRASFQLARLPAYGGKFGSKKGKIQSTPL